MKGRKKKKVKRKGDKGRKMARVGNVQVDQYIHAKSTTSPGKNESEK
jgi:hypothetical protein